MRGYLHRYLERDIKRHLRTYPVVAIIGPRQCGKTTLAKAILADYHNTIHVDLERPSDLNKLRDPETFFKINRDKLICLDEIQRLPDIFPVIRSVVDINPRKIRFLILGSASPDLLRQSSESLAGRIAYVELTPFTIHEIPLKFKKPVSNKIWLRGGFPRSFLATNNKESLEWRENFIRTYLERDINVLGFKTPALQLQRFWTMCAHINGQVVNLSQLGNSLNVSYHTIKNYMDMLEQTFMVRTLQPFLRNIGKRLVKSPKIFIRDTGILHALLGINSMNDLLGHPVYGSSWEGFVMEQILPLLQNWQASYFRTEKGNEVDLILERGRRRIIIEIKASPAPQIGKGFYLALKDIKPSETWIAAPVQETYPFGKNIKVASPQEIFEHLQGD